MAIQEMEIDHYDDIIEMFKKTPGVTLRVADSKEATKRYLARNPGLSFVAVIDSKVVGCIMCGHDGRRGYLQHLVVLPKFRKQGLGEKLVMSTIDALEKIDIKKTHIFVFKTNVIGNMFWPNKGWSLREDINMYSFNKSNNKNI